MSNKSQDEIDAKCLRSFSGIKGHDIKQIRKSFGWSQADLAEILGASRSTIYRWEKDDISELESSSEIAMNNLYHIYNSPKAKSLLEDIIIHSASFLTTGNFEELSSGVTYDSFFKVLINTSISTIGPLVNLHPRFIEFFFTVVRFQIKNQTPYLLVERFIDILKHLDKTRTTAYDDNVRAVVKSFHNMSLSFEKDLITYIEELVEEEDDFYYSFSVALGEIINFPREYIPEFPNTATDLKTFRKVGNKLNNTSLSYKTRKAILGKGLKDMY